MNESSMLAQGSIMSKVLQFNGTNFLQWKMRMKAYLEEKNLYQTVEYPIMNEDETIVLTGANVEEMKQKSRTAYTILLLALSDEQLSMMMDVESGNAYEVWKRLHDKYERKTQVNKILLRKQLHTLHMNENESVDMYITRLKQLVVQLQGVGDQVTENEKLTVLVSGLPDEYNSLVDMLSVNTDITFENACNLLRDREERMKAKPKQDEHDMVTIIKNRNIHDGNRKHYNKGSANENDSKRTRERTCFTCNKSGHIAFYCKLNVNKPKCTFCKKIGHVAKECRNLKKNEDKKTIMNIEDHVEDEIFTIQDNILHTHEQNKVTWIMDSGASRHVTNNDKILKHKETLNLPIEVRVANNEKVQMNTVGNVRLSTYKDEDEIQNVILSNVGYNDKFCNNIASVAKLTDNDTIVIFDKKKAIVKRNGKTILEAPRRGNLYQFEQILTTQEHKETNDIPNIWHQRYGHISTSSLNKIIAAQAVIGYDKINIKDNITCECCNYAKAHRHPFSKHIHITATRILYRVHSDLCGPVLSKYVLTITDELSRKVWIFIIKYKSDVTDKIIQWHKYVTTQTNMKLCEFHTDGGTEYKSNKLQDYFKQHGIEHTFTTKGTPQHNGIAERINRTLFEMTRSLLMHAKLPVYFWEFAILTAVYLRNKCITTVNKTKTPDEIFSGKKPYIKHLKVFGCDAYMHIQKTKKLDKQSIKCIFIGYSTQNMAYKLYNIETRRIEISRDVIFNETQFTAAQSLPSKDDNKNQFDISYMFNYDKLEKEFFGQPVQENERISRYVNEHDEKQIDEDNTHLEHEHEDETEHKYDGQNTNMQSQVNEHKQEVPAVNSNQQRLRRHIQPPKRYNNYVHVDDIIMFMSDEPTTYEEAMTGGESKEWKNAMDEEMKALQQNNTWTLCKLPADKSLVQGKWVYKKKLNEKGEVVRYKARWVAKGYSQVYGQDYHETFAPVVKYKSLRIILTLATLYDMDIHQMDVQTAFLNATMKEDVYMTQPEGYGNKHDDMVCKLNKTLYGTKQAPHEWNNEITSFMLSLKFIQCKTDLCVFIKFLSNNNKIIITIFVDDLIIAYNKEAEKEWLSIKHMLMNKYMMKDIGECTWILGMNVQRDKTNKTLTLNQEQYARQILQEYNMNDCTSTTLPAKTNMKLTKQDCPDEHASENKIIKTYQSIVGALMYLSLSTRPDISYIVNKLSRYSSNPGQKHMEAVLHVLRYVKHTLHYALKYEHTEQSSSIGDKHLQKREITIEAYCDADWAADIDERKSTTGYIIFMNNCPIIWNSMKQKTVALSSAEAEYMAISAVCQEVKWIQQLLCELQYDINLPVNIHCDNESAIAISKNDKKHQRTKHIDIRHHYIRDLQKEGTIQVNWISTKDQIADVLTKVVPQATLEKHIARFMITTKYD